ncbi:MAG: hypothetical protein V6Z89_19785 [Desulfobacter sp.]
MSEMKKQITGSGMPVLDDTAYEITQEDGSKALEIIIKDTKHAYLEHHVLLGDGLVPASFVMEFFMECGTWFIRNDPKFSGMQLHLTALENFLVERGTILKFGGQTTIQVVCTEVEACGSDIKLKMEILAPRINKKGKVLGVKRNAIGTAVFSEVKPEAPLFTDLVPQEPEYTFYRFPPLNDLEFFEGPDALFLGRLFQTRVGETAIAKTDQNTSMHFFDCNGMDAEAMPEDVAFVVSPIGYDAIIQAGVLFALLKQAHMGLPNHADAVKIYAPLPPSGSFKVFTQFVSGDNDLFICNLICIDKTSGKVLAVMEGSGYKNRQITVAEDVHSTKIVNTNFDHLIVDKPADWDS